MPKIPQAGVFIARDTGPAGVLANPNMQDAEFAGMQQLGRGISQAGAELGEYAQKMEHAAYVAKKNEADRKVKTAWTAYQEKMLTETATPETWAKGWNDMYAKVRKEVPLEGLSKASRARVEEQMLDFQLDSTAQISAQATKQRIRNGQAEITASATLDLKNGDFESYEAKINEGAAAGFFDPAMQIKLMEEGRVQFDVESANKAINEDAFTALEALDAKSETGKWQHYGNLSENVRLSLKRQAETRVSSERAATQQSIVDRQDNGEIISDAEFESLVASKRLLPTQARWAKQQQKRAGRDPEMMVEYAQLLTAIDAYNPAMDPTHRQFAELAGKRLQFPSDFRADIMKRLNDVRTNASVKRKEGYEYIDTLLSGSFLGKINRSESGTGEPTYPAEYLLAHEKAVSLRQQLDEFLKQKPNATGPEQLKFVNELTKPDRTADMANRLGTGSTPAPKTPKEYAALKPGTTYLAPDGTIRVKPAK